MIPLPTPTEISRPHWDGAREHRLMVQRCHDCERHVFNPALFCPYCNGSDLRWVRSSGRGAVHTYTVVWRAPVDGFDPPYVIATIRLDEDWYMLSNVVGCDIGDVYVGMPVRVVFHDVTEHITLPRFEPAERTRRDEATGEGSDTS